MKFTKASLMASIAVITAMFFIGLYLVTYVQPPDPDFLAVPLVEERPYQAIGLAISSICFILIVAVLWVGAIHLKVQKLKDLNELREKGLLTEDMFKKKVDELLNDY